jgi:uncharacterized protein
MQRPLVRRLWLGAGLASVALGAVGVALPILPTVPFLILAAFCFARSNPALEQRILDHKVFGPGIRAWRERGAISRRGKLAATGAFAASIVFGLLTLGWPWVLIPPGVAAVSLSWLWTRPE